MPWSPEPSEIGTALKRSFRSENDLDVLVFDGRPAELDLEEDVLLEACFHAWVFEVLAIRRARDRQALELFENEVSAMRGMISEERSSREDALRRCSEMEEQYFEASLQGILRSGAGAGSATGGGSIASVVSNGTSGGIGDIGFGSANISVHEPQRKTQAQKDGVPQLMEAAVAFEEEAMALQVKTNLENSLLEVRIERDQARYELEEVRRHCAAQMQHEREEATAEVDAARAELANVRRELQSQGEIRAMRQLTPTPVPIPRSRIGDGSLTPHRQSSPVPRIYEPMNGVSQANAERFCDGSLTPRRRSCALPRARASTSGHAEADAEKASFESKAFTRPVGSVGYCGSSRGHTGFVEPVSPASRSAVSALSAASAAVVSAAAAVGNGFRASASGRRLVEERRDTATFGKWDGAAATAAGLSDTEADESSISGRSVGCLSSASAYGHVRYGSSSSSRYRGSRGCAGGGCDGYSGRTAPTATNGTCYDGGTSVPTTCSASSGGAWGGCNDGRSMAGTHGGGGSDGRRFAASRSAETVAFGGGAAEWRSWTDPNPLMSAAAHLDQFERLTTITPPMSAPLRGHEHADQVCQDFVSNAVGRAVSRAFSQVSPRVRGGHDVDPSGVSTAVDAVAAAAAVAASAGVPGSPAAVAAAAFAGRPTNAGLLVCRTPRHPERAQ
eukprot:TRINITY_DN10468_c0_g2_i1.p1 TRINITY_DN10468_c0_g2~~TRINITY_DN10468_c0_g2_i1.p1  ORF type:complete len:675 (+),score=112.95 TRINITY_DN10468_c0_g2_i1:126-2150(+)